MMYEPEKSDLAKGAMKLTNKAGLQTAAESVERRAGTKGNVDQQSTHRTQIRARVSQALERVRQAAKAIKKERFTALLHHIDLDLLRLSFYALARNAAPGADGGTCRGLPSAGDGLGRLEWPSAVLSLAATCEQEAAWTT